MTLTNSNDLNQIREIIEKWPNLCNLIKHEHLVKIWVMQRTYHNVPLFDSSIRGCGICFKRTKLNVKTDWIDVYHKKCLNDKNKINISKYEMRS